ncbi:hypothetical protein AB0K15_40825 [Amycolatopsis sp. NPDC049253]|uniref:hypothetical protein n=1 Tax=Amycolatopsis sp. NPDC049253 TaxID=3155274 RepID=UPI0034229B84
MTRRGLWWLFAAAATSWAGSWRIIHLEVTRWHHLDSHLHFTPPPAPPGGPAPHAGLPVIVALAVAGVAPLVTGGAVALLVARMSTNDNEQNH